MRVRLGLLVVCMGCSALPSIAPARTPAERATLAESCRAAFPEVPWSATHVIDARLPMGNSALLIGAMRMDTTTLQAVLMSPEGIVLFDATASGDSLTVHRALPPLDRKGFAEGLVGDVRQAFARPAGPPTAVGWTDAGKGVCRFRVDGERTTDVELQSQVPAAVRGYEGTSLVREIRIIGPSENGFHKRLVLRTPGIAGYTLDMVLMDRESSAGRPERLP